MGNSLARALLCPLLLQQEKIVASATFSPVVVLGSLFFSPAASVKLTGYQAVGSYRTRTATPQYAPHGAAAAQTGFAANLCLERKQARMRGHLVCAPALLASYSAAFVLHAPPAAVGPKAAAPAATATAALRETAAAGRWADATCTHRR